MESIYSSSKLLIPYFGLANVYVSNIVIGAGLGGISTAITLAAQGQQVLVLEKNDRPGGKMDEVLSDGYRFDTGPSLLTMKFVLDSLFQLAGKQTDSFLEIHPIDPICRYFYPDGIRLDAHADIRKMQRNLPEKLKVDQDALRQFFEYSKKIYDLTADLFLFDSIRNPAHIFNPQAWKVLFQLRSIDAFRTVHQANQSYFKSPHLVQLFDRYATYNGSNPFQAPATLNIIPHVEYTLGSWYIKGGMYRLTEALIILAESLGVRFQYQTPVSEILVENKRVKGIKTMAGDSIASDNVISNSDVVHTYTQLLKPPYQQLKWEKKEPSCSGLVFLWGIKKSYSQLSHHNILFSENYQQEFQEIFQNRKAPTDPTVYISITAKQDPTHAPDGCENWFVLVNMPWINEQETNTNEEVNAIRQAVFRKLISCGIESPEAFIETEKILTPAYLRHRTWTNKGSIYGLSSNHRNAAFNRQDVRCRSIKGLYFAGGSAHPGGGIPLVLLSGMLAAKAVLKDLT